jgi:hypothetical protein
MPGTQGPIEMPSATYFLIDQKVSNIYVLFSRLKNWRICDLIKKDQKIKD